MNRQTLDYLDAAELADLQADIADMMDDTQISVAVTYRDFVSTTFTPATGAQTVTYTDTSIRAIRTQVSAQEVAAAPAGLYQLGDAVYLVAQSDVSVTPTREDRIVEGSDTYEVIAWSADPLSATWRIVARLVS